MRLRVVVAATSVLALVLLVGVAVAISSHDEPTRTDQASPPISSSSKTTTSSQPVSEPPAGQEEIPAAAITSYEVGARPPYQASQFMAAGYGTVWAWVNNTVVRLDPSSGATTTLDFVYNALLAGDGGVWGIDRCPKLLQLRAPDATVLREFELLSLTSCGPSGPGTVQTSTTDAVWVLEGSTLSHVDLVSGTVDVIAMPDGPRQYGGIVALTADAQGAWVAYMNHIWHVAATTNAIDGELSLPGEYVQTTSLALAGDTLWATASYYKPAGHMQFEALRFDHAGSLSVTVPGIARVLSTDGALWFYGYYPDGIDVTGRSTDPAPPLRVGQLDPLTGRITRSTTFAVDLTKPDNTCCDFAAGDGAFWVHLRSTIFKIPNA